MRKVLAGLAVLSLAGALVGTVVGATGDLTQKGLLFRGANPFCNGSGYITPGVPTLSTFQLRFKIKLNEVRGRVTLRSALPEHTYYVRLVQGISDCFTTDTAFTTNKHGKGSSPMIHEDAHSGSAFLFVCSDPVFACGGGDDFYASGPTILHHVTLTASLAPESAVPAVP
jgi:hypothetical protein